MKILSWVINTNEEDYIGAFEFVKDFFETVFEDNISPNGDEVWTDDRHLGDGFVQRVSASYEGSRDHWVTNMFLYKPGIVNQMYNTPVFGSDKLREIGAHDLIYQAGDSISTDVQELLVLRDTFNETTSSLKKLLSWQVSDLPEPIESYNMLYQPMLPNDPEDGHPEQIGGMMLPEDIVETIEESVGRDIAALVSIPHDQIEFVGYKIIDPEEGDESPTGYVQYDYNVVVQATVRNMETFMENNNILWEQAGDNRSTLSWLVPEPEPEPFWKEFGQGSWSADDESGHITEMPSPDGSGKLIVDEDNGDEVLVYSPKGTRYHMEFSRGEIFITEV